MGNKPFTVSIYNMNGQLVYVKLISDNSNATIQIPVSSLNSGTYIISCQEMIKCIALVCKRIKK